MQSKFARIAALLVPTLSGCAAQQQQQAAQFFASCMAAVYDAPDAAPLREHVPFNSLDVSLAQLADKSYPTGIEVASIEAFQSRRGRCMAAFLGQIERSAPTLIPILQRAHSEADDDLVSLTQHKITWGDTVRRARDRGLALNETILAEQRRLAAEDQARAQALNNTLATLAIINAASQPRVTFPPAPSPSVIVVPR